MILENPYEQGKTNPRCPQENKGGQASENVEIKPLSRSVGGNVMYHSGDQLTTLAKNPKRNTEVNEETTHTALFDMGVPYAD